MSVRPHTPNESPSALPAADPVASTTGRRRAALWFATLTLLSAAVVAATGFTWRNAETFARERLLRSAHLYTVALEKGVRHAGPGAISRLEDVLADALGADVLGVAFVDETGTVRASAGELPEGELGAQPWVVRATRERKLGTWEGGGAFAAAVPTWIGCRPRRRGWGPRHGPRWRQRPGGDASFDDPQSPPDGPPPGPPGPPAALDGDDALGPPPFGGPGPPPPFGEPGPEDCRGPRLAVVLLLDPTEARQAVHQAHIQAAFVLAVLLLAWGLAWSWQRTQRRAARLAVEAQQREKLAALGEMAAVLAHEIRNPLGAIRGHAQLAAARLAGDERGARSIATVIAETTRLAALVDALLRYARPRPPDRQDTDFGALCESVVALAADEAAAVGVSFSVERDAEGPHGSCDADQVEQVLLNLVRNALQAQPDGGRALVTARRERDGVTIRVEDSGPGIPSADRDRVFAPFVTSRAEGTGLGLAIARQIAEAHGGSLTVGESEMGGAALVLRLPDALPRGARRTGRSG